MNLILMGGGAAILTTMIVYVAVTTGQRLAYHWRHAAHVIAAEEWPELPPVADFGAMSLGDEIEWRQQYGGLSAGACLDLPDWPPPDPDPGSGRPNLPDLPWEELLTEFPRWQEPTRLADTGDIRSAGLLAEITDACRVQDADAAEYLSRFRSECAQVRIELAAALA